MFLKLNTCYNNSTNTYPVLVRIDSVDFFDPIEEGEEGFEQGLRTRISFTNDTLQVVETLYYIAEKVQAQ